MSAADFEREKKARIQASSLKPLGDLSWWDHTTMCFVFQISSIVLHQDTTWKCYPGGAQSVTTVVTNSQAK